MNLMTDPVRLPTHLVTLPIVDDETVLFASEDETRLVQGVIYARLLPMIDGQHTAREMAQRLAGQHTLFDVVTALADLRDAGCLAPINSPHESRFAYWESQQLTASTPTSQSVTVHGTSDEHQVLRDALKAVDLNLDDTSAALDLVLVDDYLQAMPSEFNQTAKRPWLPVKLTGKRAWFGPLIVPGETACWECLMQRLQPNRELHHLLSQMNGSAPKLPRATNTAAIQSVAHLVATQVARWLISPSDHPLTNTLFTFNVASCEIERHAVVRRLQCKACGTGKMPEPTPVVLESRPISTGEDGGHRLLSAEQTLERYQHHVSPLTGIVPQLTATTDDGVTHVYSAGHHSPRPASKWDTVLERRRNNAGGKGVTAAQAKAGALAEALERYSSIWEGTEHHLVATMEELGEAAIHPNECMLFSDAQYDNRETINTRSDSMKQHVPHRFDPQEPHDWVKTWSLSGQRWRYLPAAYAQFGYRHLDPAKLGKVSSGDGCIGESNGNAAGTCLEDAILQGFLELVERDSVALWWYNRVKRGGVDLRGIDDAYLKALRTHYASINREFWVLDLTSDLGVPAFTAISRRTDGGPDELTKGYGAHLDPRIAILRAITEMNQLMPHALRKAERDDRQLDETTDALSSRAIAVNDHPYVLPDPSIPEKGLADFPNLSAGDLRDEVEHCRNLVEQKGMEMLVLDLTRPDIEMPVVKVIVPGMRHFWRRLGPGRLYDVPVKMGWMNEPTAEADVNPIELCC